MTAITAITQISSEYICLNEGDADVEIISGILAADTAPGTAVYLDKANNNWVKVSDAAGGYVIGQIGVVGYKKRVNQTTNALKLITDNYDVSEAEDKIAPIIISGIVAVACVDQNAVRQPGTSMGISTTAGALTITTIGTTQENAILAMAIADDDVFCVVGIGKCKGKLWAGPHP